MSCGAEGLRMTLLINHRSTSGFPLSKKATSQLKTCHDLAVLRRAKMRKTSKKLDRPLMKIVERPLSKFLKKQMSWSSCQRILIEDLRMRRCPPNLCLACSEEQKDNCMNVCRDLKEELCNDPNFLTKTVTGDESWCYAYDPETKQASSQ
jgi:hypothetical protein